MSYDKRYYDERTKELEDNFKVLRERSFDKIVQLVNEFSQDAGKIQQKFQEIMAAQRQMGAGIGADRLTEAKEVTPKK